MQPEGFRRRDDLMKDIRPGSAETIDAYIEEDNIAAMDFSLELFKMNLLCQNTLISPVSVLSALGMTANGARENTLAEMEAVFGLPREKINQLMNLYMRNLPDEEKLKVSMAKLHLVQRRRKNRSQQGVSPDQRQLL